MNLREAAQQALEALEQCGLNDERRSYEQERAAITALRAALAENAMQRLTDEQQMIERGTKAWAGVPDATAWVEELRGHEPVTDCHEKDGGNLSPPLERHADTSKTSAHIPDATKMMATSQESLQVEPVAWAIVGDGKFGKYELGNHFESEVQPNFKYWENRGYELIPLYPAPPKRKPLTDEEMWDVIGSLADTRLAGPLEKLIRATERAHDIGGEK